MGYFLSKQGVGDPSWLDEINKYVNAGADVAKSVDQAVDTGTDIYRRFAGSSEQSSNVPVEQSYSGTHPPQSSGGSVEIDYGGVQGSVKIGEEDKSETTKYLFIGAAVLLAVWLIT